MKPWFKHYRNADTSKDLGLIIDEMGVEGYGRYWLLMELLYDHFDGEQNEFVIPTRELVGKLVTKDRGHAERVLARYSALIEDFSFTSAKGWITLRTSIPLKLLGRDFKKRVKSAPNIYIKSNRKKSNRKKIQNKEQTALPIDDSNWLVELWNANSGDLPKVRPKISKKRKAMIQKAIKEFPEKEDWLDAIRRLAESDFANGRTEKSDWVATFDFMLKPGKLEKILEGAFDNRSGSSNKSHYAQQYERMMGEQT